VRAASAAFGRRMEDHGPAGTIGGVTFLAMHRSRAVIGHRWTMLEQEMIVDTFYAGRQGCGGNRHGTGLGARDVARDLECDCELSWWADHGHE